MIAFSLKNSKNSGWSPASPKATLRGDKYRQQKNEESALGGS